MDGTFGFFFFYLDMSLTFLLVALEEGGGAEGEWRGGGGTAGTVLSTFGAALPDLPPTNTTP